MLTGVKTLEVSLVHRGANNKRFALTKTKDSKMTLQELLAKVLNTQAEGESEIKSTLKSAGASDESIEVAVANFRLQTGFKDKLSADQLSEVLKAADMTIEVKDEGKAPEGDDKAVVLPEMSAELKKAFDVQATALAKMQEEAEESKKALAEMQKSAVKKEFIAKCEKSFAHVPGDNGEHASMLQKAYEVSQDFGKQLEKQFTDTEAAIKNSSLLKSAGSAGPLNSEVGGALSKMETLAKEYSDKEKVSESEAMGLVMERHPELYAEYVGESN